MIKEPKFTLDLDLRFLISMAYSGKLQIQGAPTCDHCKKFKKLHEIDTILVNKEGRGIPGVFPSMWY